MERVGRRVRPALLVFGLLLAVYATTAQWSPPYHIDPLTNALTAATLASTGSPVAPELAPLTAPEQYGNTAWFVDGAAGPVGQYPPGAALATAPFYLLDTDGPTMVTSIGTNRPEAGPVTVPMPPVWPATLAAVVVVAGFAAALTATLAAGGVRGRDAAIAGLLAGLTTSAWAVASAQSWTHGPAMLAIGLGLLAASRDRWALCGLALGAGVLCRPHVAVIASVLGLWVSVNRRTWPPVLGVGAGSGLGVVALLLWNAWVFGGAGVSGGYSDGFLAQLVATDWSWFVSNVVAGFVDWYGLLLWAPHLLLLGGLAFWVRGELPDWSVAAAVGGVAYLLVQWKANRASGGAGFFPYRYPLEAIAAAAPLLALAAVAAWHGRGPGSGTFVTRGVLVVLTLVALLGQVGGIAMRHRGQAPIVVDEVVGSSGWPSVGSP